MVIDSTINDKRRKFKKKSEEELNQTWKIKNKWWNGNIRSELLSYLLK